MSDNMRDNLCDAREVDKEMAEDELLEDRIFSINVEASFTYPIQDILDDEDDDELDLDCLGIESVQRTHQVPYDSMYKDPQSAIYDMLVSMRIPVEDHFIDEISTCAGRMSVKECYKNRKVLRMSVRIDVVCDQSPFEDNNDDNDEKPASVPASKEAIEGLEKVVMVDDSNDCSICLEKISEGLEARRLPCSHMFHGDCIVIWLGLSSFCPICRFRLPS